MLGIIAPISILLRATDVIEQASLLQRVPLWDGSMRPRFVPRTEIGSLAAEMLARHGPRAEEVASAEEESAWRNSRPSSRESDGGCGRTHPSY